MVLLARIWIRLLFEALALSTTNTMAPLTLYSRTLKRRCNRYLFKAYLVNLMNNLSKARVSINLIARTDNNGINENSAQGNNSNKWPTCISSLCKIIRCKSNTWALLWRHVVPLKECLQLPIFAHKFLKSRILWPSRRKLYEIHRYKIKKRLKIAFSLSSFRNYSVWRGA